MNAIVVPNTDDGVCNEDVRAVAVDNYDPGEPSRLTPQTAARGRHG